MQVGVHHGVQTRCEPLDPAGAEMNRASRFFRGIINAIV